MWLLFMTFFTLMTNGHLFSCLRYRYGRWGVFSFFGFFFSSVALYARLDSWAYRYYGEPDPNWLALAMMDFDFYLDNMSWMEFWLIPVVRPFWPSDGCSCGRRRRKKANDDEEMARPSWYDKDNMDFIGRSWRIGGDQSTVG